MRAKNQRNIYASNDDDLNILGRIGVDDSVISLAVKNGEKSSAREAVLWGSCLIEYVENSLQLCYFCCFSCCYRIVYSCFVLLVESISYI